jgi:AcrR family transcriptional regulator
MYDGGQHTVQEIADTFGVSRPTLYRHLTDRGTSAAEPA